MWAPEFQVSCSCYGARFPNSTVPPRKAFCDAHGIAVEAWSPLSGQNASALSDPTVKDGFHVEKIHVDSVVDFWRMYTLWLFNIAIENDHL